MATPTQSLPPDSSSTGPSPSTTDSNNIGPGSLPPLSLCLYIFSVILALFVTILGVLVTRSVRRRRQRNASFVAALASGSYGPSIARRGKYNGAPESKPVLWESFISAYDGGKGWAGLLPVAGVESVPAHEAMSQHPASRQARLRFPHLGTRRPVAPDLPPTAPTLGSPASSSEPIFLTVLVSMPTPPVHEKARQGNRGPPVVEFGVAQVTYTPNIS